MKLLEIDTSPYVQVSFVEKASERYWKRRIALSQKIVNLETLLVARGMREAATMLIKPAHFSDKIKEFGDRGLYFTPIAWTKTFNGFFHKHIPTTPDDPDGVCYGVVTRKKHLGIRFREASRDRTDHDLIGALLGYPLCCRTFFKKVWEEGYIDPIWQQGLNSGGKVTEEREGWYGMEVRGYKECVAFQRYWGVRVSFHLPCSFTCEATRTLAKGWLQAMEEYDFVGARAIDEILSLPAIWDAYQGVAVVHTPHFKGVTNSVPCADIHSVRFTAG